MHPIRGIVVTFTLTALALKGVTPGLEMGGRSGDELIELKQTLVKIGHSMRMPPGFSPDKLKMAIRLIPEKLQIKKRFLDFKFSACAQR